MSERERECKSERKIKRGRECVREECIKEEMRVRERREPPVTLDHCCLNILP